MKAVILEKLPESTLIFIFFIMRSHFSNITQHIILLFPSPSSNDKEEEAIICLQLLKTLAR